MNMPSMYQNNSEQSSNSNADDECLALLPPDFVPGKWDVICQRGKECFDHVGNRRFRMCIESHLDNYMKVKSRQQKSKIVTTIVLNIRKQAAQSGGGFVRKDLLTRRWFKVGDKLAREKVGQALRDAIKTRRATSKKANSKDSETKKLQMDEAGLKSQSKQQHAQHQISPLFHSSNMALPLMNQMARATSQDAAFHSETSAINSATMPLVGHQSQQQQHHHQQQQQQHQQQHLEPSIAAANGLYFDNQLSADLEPTPIQHQAAASMFPGIFEQAALSNILSDPTSAAATAAMSARLRFFDMDGRRASLNNIVTNSASGGASLAGNEGRSIPCLSNSDPAKIASALDNLGSLLPAARSQSYPSYEQQLLPTVIERRRHSLVGGVEADHSTQRSLDQATNPYASLKTEFQTMVENRLAKPTGIIGNTASKSTTASAATSTSNNGAAENNNSVWDDLLGRINSSHEV